MGEIGRDRTNDEGRTTKAPVHRSQAADSNHWYRLPHCRALTLPFTLLLMLLRYHLGSLFQNLPLEDRMAAFSIDPTTNIASTHLTVANLARSERFYTNVLGFRPLERSSDTLTLTADGTTPLLALTELPGAPPKPARATGLYHFAILTPSRRDLARSLRRLAEMRHPLGGASDHLVSEALYLDDPDGNGIEIYRDRPRAEWPRMGGQIQMATEPLNLDSLLGELADDDQPWDGLAPATTIGHMHLHVADLKAAEAFYHGVLGFDMIVRYGPSALFVSAGGYHHHIGLNTWAGVGAPPAPAGSAGLRYFVVRLPNQAALDAVLARVRAAEIMIEDHADGALVRDASQNALVLALAA
jgi:catechol 2,3-dioxygenase